MGGVALLTVGWIALPPASVNRSPAPPMATPVSEPAPPTVAALQELDTRIAQQEAQIQRLLAAERLQQAQARLARLPKEHPEQQIAERAARAVVEQADRVLHETSQSAAALRAYQEVIEYFPQTASAEQAQRRIHDLQKAG